MCHHNGIPLQHCLTWVKKGSCGNKQKLISLLYDSIMKKVKMGRVHQKNTLRQADDYINAAIFINDGLSSSYSLTILEKNEFIVFR